MRSEGFIAALVLACAALAHPAFARERAPTACPVTMQPDPAFVPPAPYKEELTGRFWFGTNGLFTSLAEDGIWRGIVSPRGTRNKFWWWREGWKNDTDFRPNDPGLVVTARRIDGDAPVVRETDVTNAESTNGWAMLTLLEIPSCGCWQITGNYRSEHLTVVVWVPDKPLDDAQ